MDDAEGTAAKCHFCAHRIEVGLAPACVSVCPEQAIKVVDFDDPATVALLDERGAVARKPERGTLPRTLYLGADPATLDPLAVDGTRTLSHASVPDPLPAPGNAEARSVYDVPRPRRWGGKIAAYLVTKAAAAGALLLAASSALPPLSARPEFASLDPRWLGLLSLVLLAATGVLLIADLHKPARFFYLLTMPNTGSWLVRGAWVLALHGAIALAWTLGLSHPVLAALSVPSALMTAIYTAFLFRQARGREMWCEDRLLPWTLGLQAVAAMAAIAWCFGIDGGWVLAALIAYLAVVGLDALLPGTTRAARRGHELMIRHPAFAAGVALALGALFLAPLVFVAFLCLDWAYVHAGQEVPLS
ncbi:MAG: hypothetical protein DWQ30_23850 [Acidobacteria bacterium]|nr:MAG: hypothetical protein DWQ30_23850 [Acidobacteriota bacterium]